jgi:hypothetical protein
MPTYFNWNDINISYQRDGANTATLLEEALRVSQNERDIMRFIKQHPHIVGLSEFHWGSNDLHVFFEFALGSERAVDILVLGCHSGGWCPTLIEVQDPNAALFKRNGDPSPALSEGVRQVTQWRDFIRRIEAIFRQDLARRLPPTATAHSKRHKLAATELVDPDEHLDFNWWVLTGRSSSISDDEAKHRRLYQTALDGIEIATFDRLLNHWKTS